MCYRYTVYIISESGCVLYSLDNAFLKVRAEVEPYCLHSWIALRYNVMSMTRIERRVR